ncbi:MAG: helix-turn-helix domain-containing protein [Microcoleaceae cyanobacterium]
MSSGLIPDYGPQLQHLMQQAELPSLTALSQKARVSEWQLTRLQRGLALQTRAEILLKISQALNISLTQLLAIFAPTKTTAVEPKTGSLQSLQALQIEYQRLQRQLEEQAASLQQDFQRASIQALESWMIQWPTVAHRARENPELSAAKVLPLLRPVEQLLEQWEVEPIANVGQTVPYDPQIHQLLEGISQPGDPVIVRYGGYRYQGQLLYRVKVSPVSSN